MLALLVKSFVVFLAAMSIDTCYVMWFKFSATNHVHKAAAMSLLIGALSLVGAYFVIADTLWMCIPDLIGLYFGTVAGMYIGNKWEAKHE